MQSLYFAPTELVAPLVDHLACYRDYLETVKRHLVVTDCNTVYLDYDDLAESVPIFHGDMASAPSTTIALLSLAAHQVLTSNGNNGPTGRLTVRFTITNQLGDDHIKQRIVRFSELKASMIGSFGVFLGTVVKAAAPRPMVQQLVFTCGRCNAEIVVKVANGIFRQPQKCMTVACASKLFTLQRHHPSCTYRNWQRIKIQERILSKDGEDEQGGEGGGRVPRCLEVELVDDLVERVAPGEQVLVSGVVRVDEGEGTAGADVKKLAVSYSLLLECNNVVSLHDSRSLPVVIDEKTSFTRLVASLCPHIYGHTMVKAGLVLALLSGRPSARRSDIHVLLLGDPGLGKSELLNAVHRVAPRSVFVSANAATVAGLTASLSMEPGTGEWGLEAGALVIADGGVCCIDELDKTADHKCMLEAMEQQRVNIAKAGIVCSLPARCSVIAAANPVNGHYNTKRPLHENIRLDSALLSRFDLLFLLLDRADVQLDRYLSERIVRSHQQSAQTHQTQTHQTQTDVNYTQTQSQRAPQQYSTDIFAADDEVSMLASRLSANYLQPLPAEHLKQYLQHARHAIHPRLSEEARALIKAYYLQLRQANSSPHIRHSTPITIRHLEALVRLSEAKAKSELRSLVTPQDAQDAIALMKFANAELLSVASSPHATSTTTKSRSGTGKGAQLKRFVTELQALAARTDEPVFQDEQLSQLHATLQLTIGFGELIESLNHNGFLLRRGNGYKILASTL